jgi:cysteine desulfurase family protein (TIGR01976 family)
MGYDVQAVRAYFPALLEGAAHFDGPGGSLVPDVVGERVAATLTSAIANRGRSNPAERRADDIVVEARRAMADLLAAEPEGIVFGRSMTQLTYDFSRALAKTWSPRTEVVVTRLDHDANIRPWVQAASAVGATVRWVDFDPKTGELELDAFAGVVTDRTALVAVTAASNLIGTRPPVSEICRLAHDAGALVYMDGVHLTAHALIDFAASSADFYACSPYKFLGPHCGVVASWPDLLEGLYPDKLLASTDSIPERFELGTLPYELLAGTRAAVDFLSGLAGSAGPPPPGAPPPPPDPSAPPATLPSRRQRLTLSMGQLEAYEENMCSGIEARLASIDRVVLYGRPLRRTPTLLFSVTGVDATEVQARLAAAGVNAPAGSFYAIEASRHLGLGASGAVRAGIAPYTDQSDADRLVEAVAAVAAVANNA